MNLLTKIAHKFFNNSKSEDIFSFAFNESPIASLVVNTSGEILQINNSFSTLMGYAEKELLDEKMSIFKSAKHDNKFYKDLWENLLEEKKHSFEIFNKHKNGTLMLISEKIQFVKSLQKDYFIITFEDITQQRELENRQSHLATHDPLTGLANRALLDDRYKHAILNAKRNNTMLAVIICDINEFKNINDTYGHSFGDEVLKEISNRLKNFIRESDTVSRYGGDEFILILEQIDRQSIKQIKEEISKILAFNMDYADKSCYVTSSIGHGCFPSDGVTFEQLVNKADMAMYNTKRAYYGYQ